jgi:hypothetical protein
MKSGRLGDPARRWNNTDIADAQVSRSIEDAA